jgi:hypothetical protein
MFHHALRAAAGAKPTPLATELCPVCVLAALALHAQKAVRKAATRAYTQLPQKTKPAEAGFVDEQGLWPIRW